MTKIDLIKNRKPGDSLLVTWKFIRKEYIPIVRYFILLCLPFIVFEQILHYLLSVYVYTGNVDSDFVFIGQIIWCVMISFTLICWMQLFSISYLRVYLNKLQLSPGQSVDFPEVLKMMADKLHISLIWSLCATGIIGVASCLFLLPGIYLGVGLTFTIYYIILKDTPLIIMTKSIQLIHGIWWKTFGYLLLLFLIVGGSIYLLFPFITNVTFGVFTGDFFQEYYVVLLSFLATLGICLILIVTYFAIGMKFLKLCTRQESYAILNKIEWGSEYD